MDLPRSQLKISQLQAFVAVAQHGNFSTAALELGLSQSTVSHAISTMEAALGVILLARGRHGAALTSIGEQILPEAQQILALLGSIQTKASLDNGLQSGVVRIACVRSIATHLLPDAIVQFRQKFPLIHVVIRDCEHYVEVQQTLRDGQAEIAITLMPDSAEFEAWQLIRDEFVLLLPANAVDAANPAEPLTWEQIAQFPFIMNPIAAPHVHTRTVQAHFAQFGHQLHVAYEVKEDSTIIGMVQRGLGATIMARLAAEPIPDSIQMRRLPVPLDRKIGIVIRADSLLSKAAFAFIDILKASHQS
jgi:DNA-binding transcriptional LysR family regulator